MHSPPVQPISSSSSGHRLGDHHVARGQRQPAAHPRQADERAAASRAPRRRREPVPARPRRPRLAAAPLDRPHRAALEDLDPGARSPARAGPRARRAGCTVAAPGIEGRRRGRSATRSAAGPPLARAAGRRRRRRARGRPRAPAPRRRPRPARSRPACSRPGETRRRPPARRRSAPISSTELLGGARDVAIAASSPKRSRIAGRLNQSPLTEAAVAPARPLRRRPPASSTHDPRLGLEPLQVPGGPEPGVAAADDDHVGAPLALERGRRLDRPGLVEPVAVGVWRSRPSAVALARARPARRLDRCARGRALGVRSISSRWTSRGSPSGRRRVQAAVGAELPGVGVVGERAVEHVDELGAHLVVDDRGRPARPGCRGCAASGRPSRCRRSRARRGARTSRSASARGSGRRPRSPRCSPRRRATPGTQGADPAHVELHLDPGLRGPVERPDRRRVEQRVHLQPDPRRASRRECDSIVRSISSRIPLWRLNGATSTLR